MIQTVTGNLLAWYYLPFRLLRPLYISAYAPSLTSQVASRFLAALPTPVDTQLYSHPCVNRIQLRGRVRSESSTHNSVPWPHFATPRTQAARSRSGYVISPCCFWVFCAYQPLQPPSAVYETVPRRTRYVCEMNGITHNCAPIHMQKRERAESIHGL
ncbi:hypothetical protein BOTBODRAFT_577697 [Botryobasidium botryosum FD-172 SS1]|uniref:Uncharacterized protein n=1 Tax=Botryobasidium botryosum (strain FD-172 SS1) TaxID=930990 RepID=A0A067MP73_BOTB1|nr:hypothetical protein BOTBODRAFT_577697 [Botryobasidium botryosum FD-172 SS1]